MSDNEQNLYIILARTPTIPSKIIKKFTGGKYTHASLSLNENLTQMYSFARLHKYLPLPGGFIKEYTDKGVYGRFPNTEICIIKLPTNETEYNKVKTFINLLYTNRKSYKYNLLGVIFAAFNKQSSRKHKYYCSEFVRAALVKNSVLSDDALPQITKPMDYYTKFCNNIIYTGKISDYTTKIHHTM